jgi:hypothetical protein
MGQTSGGKIDMEGDAFGDQQIDEPNAMVEKKCAHKVNMKGHGKPWCVLFRKEANCSDCFGVGQGTKHEKIKRLYNDDNKYRCHRAGHRRQQLQIIEGILPENKLAAIMQSQKAFLSQKEMVAKLIGRPGVTLLHDEFIVDEEEWVSPFTEGELVLYNDQLARVVKITGPVVKIKLQSRYPTNHLDVMDWEIEKRSFRKWVKKQWRKLRRKV